jgi:hypothetical protein
VLKCFDRVFQIELLVCGVLYDRLIPKKTTVNPFTRTLFFLFYFNRLFATLVSYGIRAWTWHKYRVYIDVQALQISLLGGSIFFKGLRYHGNNETILLQSGYITWSYWLRKVRELNLAHSQDFEKNRVSNDSDRNKNDGNRHPNLTEEGGIKSPQKLPCRLSVSIKGAEWFIYNRSAAYDAVIAGSALKDGTSESITANYFGEINDAEGLKKRFRFRSSEKSENRYDQLI